MVLSMTGFSTGRGTGAGAAWQWDLRGVNGRGFDLRLRLPDGIDGLEQLLRTELARVVHRGSVTLSLKLQREIAPASLRIDQVALMAVLTALKQVEEAALSIDVALAPTSAAEVLGQRGVLGGSDEPDEGGASALLAELKASFVELLDAFQFARAAEGVALAKILAEHIVRISELVTQARGVAEARKAQAADALREALTRLLGNAEGFDEARVAQELALLAVKQDVTEELDRLDAHVAQARQLLAEPGPVGRKLDFLMQEFNREANTLCSKAQSGELTRLGLDLKVVIDQMREQVQNVE